MIILGGEPPFIENPEPRFGGVISKLNEMTYKLEACVHSYNEGTKEKIRLFNANLNDFINQAIVPIDAHINSRGAVHGETKRTIGLGLKDNYRTATLEEQQSLAPVLAYVTPHGARAAVVTHNVGYNGADYQPNDVFQFSSFYNPDEYPVVAPTVIQPIRYFGYSLNVGMMINNDRLVLSPVTDPSRYQRYTAFLSGSLANAGGTQFSEIQNLNAYYTGRNWNAVGGFTSSGKVAFFKPLAEKKIYEFKNTLPLTPSSANFLLYQGYSTAVYKGLGVSWERVGTVLTLKHYFFNVNFLETDPTLVEQVTASYTARFTQINKTPYTGPANGSHSYDINDFVTLSAGQTLEMNGGLQPTTALFWNIQDREIYLFVVIPVNVVQGGIRRPYNLSFVESIVPGTLENGGTATFTQLGNLVKDIIQPNMLPTADAKWLRYANTWDFNNPTWYPGIVLKSGEVVKAVATKNGLRVKRFTTPHKGLREWVLGERAEVGMNEVRTEFYPPSRHSPFGPVPDRLFPIEHTAGTTRYLAYSVDSETGLYEWSELTWSNTSIVGVTTGNKFGMVPPDVGIINRELTRIPRAMASFASLLVDGVSINALCFTPDNQYTGYASIALANGRVQLGAEVKLSPTSLITLQAASGGILARAAIANPQVNNALRESVINVFAVADNFALVVITDGMCYAEAAVVPYTVSGGVFRLNFPSATGFVTKPVTPAGMVVPGTYRYSHSGDNPWMTYVDIQVIETQRYEWAVVVSRPFGDLYGDISFKITDYPFTPTYTVGRVNPAKLYTASSPFDTVNEVHPPVLIPRKGIYQYDPANTGYSTNLLEVGGAGVVDPYDVNESGWVSIPARSRVVIRGRAYILDKEYPIKVNPAGTTYCYLVRQGDALVGLGSPVRREVNNSEVLFGIATNGILTIDHSYIVMGGHVVSSTRRGTAIPTFVDDGNLGANTFFTRRDIID